MAVGIPAPMPAEGGWGATSAFALWLGHRPVGYGLPAGATAWWRSLCKHPASISFHEPISVPRQITSNLRRLVRRGGGVDAVSGMQPAASGRRRRRLAQSTKVPGKKTDERGPLPERVKCSGVGMEIPRAAACDNGRHITAAAVKPRLAQTRRPRRNTDICRQGAVMRRRVDSTCRFGASVSGVHMYPVD